MPASKYTIRDDPALVNTIISTIGEWSRYRESVLQDPTGYNEAPGNVWDTGDNMWSNSANHMPSKWRTVLVPEDLGLGDVPHINIYKSFVEQISASILTSIPSLEFIVGEKIAEDEADMEDEQEIIEAFQQGDYESIKRTLEVSDARSQMGYITKALDHGWEKMSHESRALSELDLNVVHNCNYGFGCLALHTFDDRYMMRATHPRLIIVDPYAERSSDIRVVAKVTSKQAAGGRMRSNISFDSITWPDTLLPHPEMSEVVMEVWIKKGTEFAGRKWDAHGMYLKIGGDGTVQDESPLHAARLPLSVSSLIPSDRIYGESLSAILWQAQVRVDKVLAILLSRASRAAGEKYHSQSPNVSAGNKSGAMAGISNLEDIRKPGVRVIFSESALTPLPTDHVPSDLMEMYKLAVSDMERIAGLSQPFQGRAPQGITAGIAIQTLATMSSRRVNRMATHLVEALRDFGYIWAEHFLLSVGIKLPKDLEITVHMAAVEESTKQTTWTAIKEMLQLGIQIDPSALVDVVPGLTAPLREALKKSVQTPPPVPAAGENAVDSSGMPPEPGAEGPLGEELIGLDVGDPNQAEDLPTNLGEHYAG